VWVLWSGRTDLGTQVNHEKDMWEGNVGSLAQERTVKQEVVGNSGTTAAIPCSVAFAICGTEGCGSHAVRFNVTCLLSENHLRAWEACFFSRPVRRRACFGRLLHARRNVAFGRSAQIVRRSSTFRLVSTSFMWCARQCGRRSTGLEFYMRLNTGVIIHYSH
jgi:hypothetical protein